MRKLNHPQANDSVIATPDPQRGTSWIPRSALQPVALDPARWSQRAQQRRHWLFIEAQRHRMH